MEEAFYTTDRVMTASFHLRQEWGGQPFFPGTGALTDVGEYQVGVWVWVCGCGWGGGGREGIGRIVSQALPPSTVGRGVCVLRRRCL